jgi:hypothetical protein
VHPEAILAMHEVDRSQSSQGDREVREKQRIFTCRERTGQRPVGADQRNSLNSSISL